MEKQEEIENRINECLEKALNKDCLTEYMKQAENGDVLAQRILGDVFFYGITADKKYFREINYAVWYAGRSGNYGLISVCREKPNYIEALKWYERAAESGDVYAEKQTEKILNGILNHKSNLATQIFTYEK